MQIQSVENSFVTMPAKKLNIFYIFHAVQYYNNFVSEFHVFIILHNNQLKECAILN